MMATTGVLAMTVLLALLDPSQGQNTECLTAIGLCSLGLEGMAEGGEGGEAATTAAGFQQSCTLMKTASACFNKLDGDCKGSDLGKNAIKALEFGLSACNALTAKGECNAAVECFVPYMESDADMTCSAVETFLDCLHGKAMGSGCTIDESKMSFATVKNITAEMCALQQSCAQADDCIQMPGIPDMTNMDMSNIGDQVPITADLTSPGYYCRLMQAAAKCYMDNADACNFNDAYKTVLMDKHDELKKKCPEESSGGRSLVPEMLGLATMILVSIWSVL